MTPRGERGGVWLAEFLNVENMGGKREVKRQRKERLPAVISSFSSFIPVLLLFASPALFRRSCGTICVQE
jgi:hypothetical protein